MVGDHRAVADPLGWWRQPLPRHRIENPGIFGALLRERLPGRLEIADREAGLAQLPAGILKFVLLHIAVDLAIQLEVLPKIFDKMHTDVTHDARRAARHSSMVVRISVAASSTAPSALTQDWLSCVERKKARIG